MDKAKNVAVIVYGLLAGFVLLLMVLGFVAGLMSGG